MEAANVVDSCSKFFLGLMQRSYLIWLPTLAGGVPQQPISDEEITLQSTSTLKAALVVLLSHNTYFRDNGCRE